MVFQDPTDSLNPRFTAARAIADPIMQLGDIKGGEALRARCEELAKQVGLPLSLLDRFPHQMSGGQKARVGIARAIALKPDLIILDEPTAALDVHSGQVVMEILSGLARERERAVVIVTHDLAVARLLSHRMVVMRHGRVIETGLTDQVLDDPREPYTQLLVSSVLAA
jgi:peptide/nickel transport system ATP-binding protein